MRQLYLDRNLMTVQEIVWENLAIEMESPEFWEKDDQAFIDKVNKYYENKDRKSVV